MTENMVVDHRISIEALAYLSSLKLNIIKMPSIPSLDKSISAHPDMSILKISEHLVVYDEVAHLFGDVKNLIVIKREVPGGYTLKYPHDVGLNCAVVGNNLLCNKKYTEEVVIDIAKQKNINIIDVKQGYTKCSTCVVDTNAIITEDAGIAKKCVQHGIDVLLLENRYVKLENYDYGFIGGCSGMYKEKILFSGKIENHPEYKKILEFCNKYRKTPVSISNEHLYDVGSIFIF